MTAGASSLGKSETASQLVHVAIRPLSYRSRILDAMA